MQAEDGGVVKLRGGMTVMSMETRWLRQDHAQALRDLREHRRRCVACERAARKRSEKPCAEGIAIREAEQELKRQAAESAQLDAAPCPGQGALFEHI